MSNPSEHNSGFGLRWATITNPEKGTSARLFAAAELVLLPLSFVTFAYVVLQAILAACGVDLTSCMPTVFTRCVLPVLVAAAIGYITNWLAILMLFRPYENHRWLFFWPQGLLPRNKATIARQIGHQVGTELLLPESLVAEFEVEAKTFLARPEVMAKARDMVQGMLNRHIDDVVRLIVPHIESAVGNIIERFVTPEQIRAFWYDTLAPRLSEPETREIIARKIVETMEAHAPELANSIREKLRAHLLARIHIPSVVENLFPSAKTGIVDAVMGFFADSDTVRGMLSDWLSQTSTQDMFRDKLLLVGEKANEWLRSEQGREKLEGFSADMRRKGHEFIARYVREALPRLVGDAFASERLWTWVETTALPAAKDRMLAYLADNREVIVERLRLAERVEAAINAQDIGRFHKMLNDLAAQHLSAIQVLGYILGAIVGAIQMVCRIA